MMSESSSPDGLRFSIMHVLVGMALLAVSIAALNPDGEPLHSAYFTMAWTFYGLIGVYAVSSRVRKRTTAVAALMMVAVFCFSVAFDSSSNGLAGYVARSLADDPFIVPKIRTNLQMAFSLVMAFVGYGLATYGLTTDE